MLRRQLNIVDEFKRECLAMRVARKLSPTDVIDLLSDLFVLPGVRIKVRPFGTALFFAAQSAMVRVDTKGEEASEVIDALRGVAFIKALARLSILEWEGVADAKGEPAPVSPDAVDALMEIWQAAAAFERIYARPISEIETEKNG